MQGVGAASAQKQFYRFEHCHGPLQTRSNRARLRASTHSKKAARSAQDPRVCLPAMGGFAFRAEQLRSDADAECCTARQNNKPRAARQHAGQLHPAGATKELLILPAYAWLTGSLFQRAGYLQNFREY